jgi:tetratricopeptide (TPR) repeat protein
VRYCRGNRRKNSRISPVFLPAISLTPVGHFAKIILLDMIFLKFSCGVLFFFLGWMYLFKPALVLTLNKIARDRLFNDRTILLERKKLAILFFCLSFVALFMSFAAVSDWVYRRGPNSWVFESNQYLMYMAMQDFCTERYTDALAKYREILAVCPDDAEAMKRMAYTYAAIGDKKHARELWEKLLRRTPNDPDIRCSLRDQLP